MMEITEIEKQAALDKISQGKRMDGRDLKELRDINVETGVAKNAEGSAKVELGETKVMVGVKMGVGDPFPDTPDEGILMVNAELGPIAAPDFESGPPGEDATELARVIDRGIRESEALPLKDLCIEEGKEVWKIMVDIHVLDYDGNLMDASALGAIMALMDANVPDYEDGEVIRDTDEELELNAYPIACTVVKIDGKYIIDPGRVEEEVADSMVTVTWMEDNISSLQKRGNGSFTSEELIEAFEIAEEKVSELRKILEGE